MVVLPVRLSALGRLSTLRVYLPTDLRGADSRALAAQALAEVVRRQGGADRVPLLDPIGDLRVDAKAWKRHGRVAKQLRGLVAENPVLASGDLHAQLAMLTERRAVERELRALKRQAKTAKTLILKEELRARVRVLTRLEFMTEDGIVTAKGRAAAEIASGDELVATEVRIM